MAGARTRAIAAEVIDAVVDGGQSLDAAIEAQEVRLPANDRPMLRMLAYGVLRHHWQLQEWIAELLNRPFRRRDSVANALLAVGIEVRETDSNRREGLCCGGGCGEYVIKRSAGLRQKAFDLKRREFDDTGAEAVVTSCANCRINLMIGADNAGWEKPVISLVETVADRLAD